MVIFFRGSLLGRAKELCAYTAAVPFDDLLVVLLCVPLVDVLDSWFPKPSFFCQAIVNYFAFSQPAEADVLQFYISVYDVFGVQVS